MTIRKLAEICGVSPATVSRSIRGEVPVKAETRRRIREAADLHQYRPRPSPRTRGAARSGLIGALLPAMDHPFAQRLLWELQSQVGAYHKTLLILPEGENSLPARIRRLPLEGAVLLSAELAEETLAALREAGFPLVMCSALPLH
jgi:LacI family transcriptional regulator